jgi:large subunit ribosomal protein L10
MLLLPILFLVLLERLFPLIQAKRFRGKINIQRPKPVHFERARYVALTQPYFLNPNKDKKPIELCNKYEDKMIEEVDNPFQRIIAEELRNRFNESRLVAFYHVNPMKSDQQFKAQIMFKKENMYFRTYGKKTLKLALENTKYESVLDFYVSQNVTVFSPEPEIKKLLKLTKKFPQLVLLGMNVFEQIFLFHIIFLAAIFEGKFINKDEIMELNLIPNLQEAQATLVQTLNSAGSTLTQQLNSHQNTLVSQLQERIKQLEEEK